MVHVFFCAEYNWTSVIPGMALHLNCSSSCLPEGATATWSLLPNHNSPAVALSANSDGSSNYVTSTNNELVILNVNASRHAGTFQCSYNNRILTRHKVSLSGRCVCSTVSFYVCIISYHWWYHLDCVQVWHTKVALYSLFAVFSAISSGLECQFDTLQIYLVINSSIIIDIYTSIRRILLSWTVLNDCIVVTCQF